MFISNQSSPPELIEYTLRCMKEKRWQEAVFVYYLAMAYGRFDSLRVRDETAHQVITVCKLMTFGELTDEEASTYSAEIDKTIHIPQLFMFFYKKIEHIGIPNYYPLYMIEHGMDNFLGNNDTALVTDFNDKDTWKKILEELAQLPQIDIPLNATKH